MSTSKDLAAIRVWTALITPMNRDGSIDYLSLKTLLSDQIAAGNGLTVLGSTAEALNLTLDEKKTLLDFIVTHAGDSPIMVGCGGAVLEDQLAWIEYGNQHAIDAFLIATPYYAKPGDAGQLAWFTELMNASNHPVCLYNIPGRSAAPLSLVAFSALATHPQFWALKEASGSVEQFAKYHAAAPNCYMLSGDDPLFGELTRSGAMGVVSVAANAWPEQTAQIAREFQTANFTHEQLFAEASTALFSASNPVPVKALLAARGDISSPTMRLPLSSNDMRDLETLQTFDAQMRSVAK